MDDYSDFEHLSVVVDDIGVATVSIPTAGSSGRRQAEIHKELAAIWTRLDDDSRARSILVTGAGDECYCSADIHGLKAVPGLDKEATFELAQRLSKEGSDIVYRLVALDKPVVAAINGTASGGGLAIALLADISIAAADARLVDPHITMGLAAGDHAAMIWPLLCGMAKSKLY
jgi:enoyl-CoA hydratase